MDCEEGSYSSEVENLRKQVEELKGIVTGIYQHQQNHSKDSNGTIPSTAASTTKKAKTNQGTAASVSGSRASRRSTSSRGSTNRAATRKQSKLDPDKKAKQIDTL